MRFSIRAAKGLGIRDGRLRKAVILAESKADEVALYNAICRLSATAKLKAKKASEKP